MGELQRPPTRRFLPESSSLCAQDRNIQLAFYSIIIYFPMAVQQTNFDILAGFTPLVWFVSCLHAAGGILVALSVLYSSSVTKTVAVSGALVLTTILGHTLFDAPLNSNILMGCIVTILSIFTYRDDGAVEKLLESLPMSERQGARPKL